MTGRWGTALAASAALLPSCGDGGDGVAGADTPRECTYAEKEMMRLDRAGDACRGVAAAW